MRRRRPAAADSRHRIAAAADRRERRPPDRSDSVAVADRPDAAVRTAAADRDRAHTAAAAANGGAEAVIDGQRLADTGRCPRRTGHRHRRRVGAHALDSRHRMAAVAAGWADRAIADGGRAAACRNPDVIRRGDDWCGWRTCDCAGVCGCFFLLPFIMREVREFAMQ